jgi:hypothetical protein
MTIDVSAQIDAGERTSLPPPRAFGETNTLTLPRHRGAGARRGVAARVVASASEADASLTVRASLVAADCSALTLTF